MGHGSGEHKMPVFKEGKCEIYLRHSTIKTSFLKKGKVLVNEKNLYVLYIWPGAKFTLIF